MIEASPLGAGKISDASKPSPRGAARRVNAQAARVAPLAAGNEADVRKSAAGDFCQ